MNNDFSYLDSLMSSMPKMSLSAAKSMLTPELEDALLGISQTFSSVALNTSAQSVAGAYKSVLSSLGVAEVSASHLSEFSRVLSTYSPAIEAAKVLSEATNCALSRSVLSEQPLSVVQAVASVAKSALESSELRVCLDDSEEYIDLAKPLADMVKQVDSSVQFPDADDQNTIRIKKTNTESFWQVVSLILAIIAILQTAYYHNVDTVSSAQDQAELMQEEELQTREEQKQTAELIKQTKILEQIEINTSSDLDSHESASTTTQSE